MKLRRNAKVELLRAVPLFSGCTTKELGQISALGDELHQPAGSELITEGVKGREFFVLIDGTVEARRNGRRVATFETGDFFGEIALLTESPRTATVVARTPVRLLVISGQSFRRLLGDTPSIQGKVLAALAERMKPTVARRDDVLRRPPAPRSRLGSVAAARGAVGLAGPRRLHGRARGQGFVVLGGPLADEETVVLAVEAASEAEVRATLALDPWSDSHLVVDRVDAWTIRLDGRTA